MASSRVTATASWSPERVSRALRLYLVEGLTATAVAEALGGVTRAAVIAKVRRLGHFKRVVRAVLTADSTTRGRTRADCQPRTRVEFDRRRFPPRLPPIRLPPLREVAATGAPVTLDRLPERACHWPIDDPGPGSMHLTRFCGGPAARGRYCAAHRAIAFRQAEITLAAPSVAQ
jgi:GcrA cell cycle regulator